MWRCYKHVNVSCLIWPLHWIVNLLPKKRLRDCALRLPKSRGVKKAVDDYLRLRALGLMVADGLWVVAKNKWWERRYNQERSAISRSLHTIISEQGKAEHKSSFCRCVQVTPSSQCNMSWSDVVLWLFYDLFPMCLSNDAATLQLLCLLQILHCHGQDFQH